MGPPVGEAGSPLEHAAPFELVDERDHATRGDLHGLPERLLGLALRRGDVAQQHDVRGSMPRGARRSFHRGTTGACEGRSRVVFAATTEISSATPAASAAATAKRSGVAVEEPLKPKPPPSGDPARVV